MSENTKPAQQPPFVGASGSARGPAKCVKCGAVQRDLPLDRLAEFRCRARLQRDGRDVPCMGDFEAVDQSPNVRRNRPRRHRSRRMNTLVRLISSHNGKPSLTRAQSAAVALIVMLVWAAVSIRKWEIQPMPETLAILVGGHALVAAWRSTRETESTTSRAGSAAPPQ